MTGLVLFLAMEMVWIAMLAVLLDGLIAGTAAPPPAVAAAAYPLGIAAGWTGRLGHPYGRLAASAGLFLALVTLAAPILLPEFLLPAALDRPALGDWLRDTETHRAIALVAVALFSWVRGAMLEGRRIDGRAVALGFQIGLIALICVFGLAWTLDLALPAAAPAAAAFVGAGLLSLWHTRSGGRSLRRGGPGAAALGMAMVAAIGGIVVVAVSPPALEAALALLALAWERVVAAIVWLFSLFPEPDPAPLELPPPEDGPPPAGRPPEQPLFQPIAWMRALFATLFFGSIALAVAVLLLSNLRDLIAWLRARLRQTPGIAYDRSSRTLGDTLRALWQALRDALTAWIARTRARLAPVWAGGAVLPLERRLYRKLSSGLDGRGWPRRIGETPLEYARRLRGTHWPGIGGELTILTRCYVASRYGGVSRSEDRLSRLWRKVRRSLSKVSFRHDQSSHDPPR